MISIGSKEVTTIFYGSKAPIIYIDNYQTWPSGTITYALTNVRVVYSSGAMINASGSNYATIQATTHTYKNGVEISTQNNVELSVSRVSASSSIWSIDDGKYISAENRGTYEGSSRSATFKGTWNNIDTTTFTITQGSNYSNIRSVFDSITIVDDEGDPIDTYYVPHAGGSIYDIYLQLNYLDTSVYTSGATLPAGSSSEFDPDEPAIPDTYEIPSGVSWLTIDQYGNLSASANTSTTTARDSSLTAVYTENDKTARATINVHQYDASIRYADEYVITETSIGPDGETTYHDEFDSSDDEGTFLVISLSAMYQRVKYENGHRKVISTTYWNITNPNVYVELSGGDTNHFQFYDVDSQDPIPGDRADFDFSGAEGSVLITPLSTNTSGEDITATLTVHFFDKTRELEVVHSGR